MSASDGKIDFEAYEYGGDVFGLTGLNHLESRAIHGEWFDLAFDGQVIGQCRIKYDDGATTFHVRLRDGHTLEARR